MDAILGLDIGSTVLKAVLFDSSGAFLDSATRELPTSNRKGGIVERDLELLWKNTAEIIRETIQRTREKALRIAVVGLAGAGDGLVLLDKDGRPLRSAISSLDTRAADVLLAWEKEGVLDALFPILGEMPFPGSPIALLRWIKDNESAHYASARFTLFLKDWIKLKLTGKIITDPTDASATLTGLDGTYSLEAFSLVKLDECCAKTTPMAPCDAIIGYVTSEASASTGLMPGTPVSNGVHDCSASSLGANCMRNGETTVIMGSWSGNQVVLDRLPEKFVLRPNRNLRLRGYVSPDKWLLLSASPGSMANLNWFVRTFGPSIQAAGRPNASVFETSEQLVRDADTAGLIFHPYLYGEIDNSRIAGAFYGIRPWHEIGSLLRAVYEGIAINHSIHINQLREFVPITEIRIVGGGTRSETLMNVLSAALDSDIRTSSSPEASALGAAIVAAVAVGLYGSFPEACRAMTRLSPNIQASRELREKMSTTIALFQKLYTQICSVSP